MKFYNFHIKIFVLNNFIEELLNSENDIYNQETLLYINQVLFFYYENKG